MLDYILQRPAALGLSIESPPDCRQPENYGRGPGL